MIKYLTSYGLKNPRIIPYKKGDYGEQFVFVADNMDAQKANLAHYYFSKIFDEMMRERLSEISESIKREIEYFQQEEYLEEVVLYIEKYFESYLVKTEKFWKSDFDSFVDRDMDFEWVRNYNNKQIIKHHEDQENGYLIFCLVVEELNEKLKKYLSPRISIVLDTQDVKVKPRIYYNKIDLEQLDEIKISSTVKNILSRGENVVYVFNTKTNRTIVTFAIA